MCTMINEVHQKRHRHSSLTRLRQLLPGSSRPLSTGFICPVCINLGNEVWDTEYSKKNGISREYVTHIIYATEALLAAKKGCSGCQIIAWALEPYMAQLEAGRARVLFEFYSLPSGSGSVHVVPENNMFPHDDLKLVLKTSPYKLSKKAFTRSKSKSYLKTVYAQD